MKFRVIAAVLALVIPSVTATAQPATPHAAAYRPYFNQHWADRGAPVTPGQVRAMLVRHTPRQVIRTLYGAGHRNQWNTVAAGIARAEPAWLALAVRLSPGTDAGTSDDFAIALGDALTRNPTATLRVLARIPMGAGACADNSFEVPDAEGIAYYNAALEAVRRVRDPALRRIKSQCIAELNDYVTQFAA